jgi:hypothetical protein
LCGRNENAAGKKGKREYFRHSGDFIHAQNRFRMEKALSFEGRSIKALALGWESYRISKVSDLKRASSSRNCLARVGGRGSSHQQSAWHQDRKTETEIERRKLISQKSSKVNKLFGKSKRNH